MSKILTVVIDDKPENLDIRWFTSDGVTDAFALLAVQAIERELQVRVVRAQLEAQRKQGEEETEPGPTAGPE